MASSSNTGVTHPPRSNPPLRSSSGPPSPCMTPSSVTSVTVVSFMAAVPFSLGLSSFDQTGPRRRSHRSQQSPSGPLFFGRGLTIEQPPYELPVLVDALAALSQWDELEATLPALRARAANVAWLAPAVDRAEAGRLAARGDTAGAESELRQALDAYRRLGMLPEVSRTLKHLADLDPSEEASLARRSEAAAIRGTMTDPKEIPTGQPV